VTVEHIVVVTVAEVCAVLGLVGDSSFAGIAGSLEAEAHIVVVLQRLGSKDPWTACICYLE